MVDNAVWFELAEVSKSTRDALLVSASDSDAVHLSLLTASTSSSIKDGQESDASKLTSAALEIVECSSTKNEFIHVHPILCEFLTYSAKRRIECESSDVPTLATQSPDKGAMLVKLASLPLDHAEELEFESESANYQWQLRPMKACFSPNNEYEIHLSCVHVDPDVIAQCTNDRGDDIAVDRLNELLSMAMQGRLVMDNSITVLNTSFGVVVVLVMKVMLSRSDSVDRTGAEDSMHNRLVRLGALASYRVHIADIDHYFSPSVDETNNSWEKDIPGYESLQTDLLNTIGLKTRMEGCSASPSGILVTGSAGTGKTRLVSTIAHHIKINQERNAMPGTIHWMSAQELLFLASTETDLVERYLLPKSDCILWVIDDLHILERDSQNGENSESGLQSRDMEYIAVLNAIVQTIDFIVSRNKEKEVKKPCNIFGIGHVSSRLPRELTKIHRLEKEITMLPPTQWQRTAIWENLLQRDVASPSQLRQWSLTLSSATSGCVAGDIVRVFQDASTRAWARQTSPGANLEVVTNSIEANNTLQWLDLSEAAWACTPSQLAELDVTKPDLPVEVTSMSWEEIHNKCWSKFGGYSATKKRAFLHVVTPWRRFLRTLGKVADGSPVSSTNSTSFEIEPPAGVLFHGPSGCGKTVAARCLAASLELPIIQVRAADVLDKWLGGSEAFLRSLFARARAASPCILFLDEVDAIANNRSEDDNELASRVLSTLLNELDGVSSGAKQTRVLVVACTNRLDALDAALLRPGRLEEHLHLDLPSANDLSDILRLLVTSMPLDETVDLETLSLILAGRGATGADVEGMCRDVCLMCMRDNVDDLDRLSLSQQKFLRAIHMM